MIIFDTETTGFVEPRAVPLARQPHIIEFCAVRLDDKTLKETGFIDFLINPGVSLPSEITKITGIKESDLLGQVPFAHRYPAISDFFLGERYVVGHNLDFDTQMLYMELQRLGLECRFPWPPRAICTVEASQPIKKYKLKLLDLYEIATNGGKLQGAHRAINDIRATAVSLRWLIKEKMVTLK